MNNTPGAHPPRTFQFHNDGVIPSGNWVWVFGSNLAGQHAKGAAKVARITFRAKRGDTEGRTGDAYAVPTQDRNFKALPLEEVAPAVERFLAWAKEHPEADLFVTRIGCGNAGFTDAQIAPLFADAPVNCSLPAPWRQILEGAR